jgi:hypothetical protein
MFSHESESESESEGVVGSRKNKAALRKPHATVCPVSFLTT